MIQLKKIMNNTMTKRSQFIEEGYNELIVDLLVNRGYDEEIITALLNPGYSIEMPAYDNITNVEIGADIIKSHIANNSIIYIYSDYDSDGINSGYVLGDAINHIIYHTESESTISIQIPERSDGYGLNINWCKDIVAKHTGEDVLVITVDNGIAQDKEVAYLLSNGIDVLITDHHRPNGHTPENVWIIDAFYNNDSDNNKGLCGTAVAFKLAMTLLDMYDIEYKDDLYYKYLVHVAIATITDSMPMTTENIQYVYNGVQLLKDGYGSEALNHYKEFNKNTDLVAKDLAFGIGPQLNACGRMNNSKLAMNFLFADSSDIEDLYNEILKTNDERKDKTKKAIEIAEEYIEPTDNSIVLNLDGVEGIAGIIASNLSNNYKLPTIIFSQAGDVLIGSGRSSQSINLLEILKYIESNTDYIVKVGGHAAACGLTIRADKFNEFGAIFSETINSITIDTTDEDNNIEVIVDNFITVSDINKTNCEALRPLYFFTEEQPKFALKDVTITKVKYSNNNPDNVCFTIKDKTGVCDTWTWKIGNIYKQLGEPKQVTLIAELDTKFGKPSLNILNFIPKGEILYE